MRTSRQFLARASTALRVGSSATTTNISSLLGEEENQCQGGGRSQHSLLEVTGCLSSLYLAVDVNQRTVMMLDGGTSCDQALIKGVLDTLGTENPDSEEGKPFKLVGCVSTHAHPDHMGTCAGWQREGVPVVLSKGSLQWYNGIGGSFQYGLDIVLGSFVRHRQGQPFQNLYFPIPSFPAPMTSALEDMTPLPFGLDQFGWMPVFSPGHTDHMFTMYHAQAKIMYVADLIVMPRNLPRPPIPIEVRAAYFETLARLRSDFEVDHMLLPHGGVVHVADYGGWKAIIDAIVKRLKTEKSFVRDYLCGWNTVLTGTDIKD